MVAIDNRTPNRDYLLPNIENLMRSQEVPRFIETFMRIDADMAGALSALAGKAPADHEHTMAAIIGLADALAGKSPAGHNHGIGTLGGVDLTGASNGQFMKFNGSIWIPAALATADLPDKGVTGAKLRDSAALSIMGRAAASVGSPGDISATANDTILRRVGDALGFGKLTAGMVSDNILTFAMLASAAIATVAELRQAAGDKIVTPGSMLGASAWVPLAYDATVAVSHASGWNFSVLLEGNPTIGNPANGKPGWPLNIRCKQDATGNRVPAWGSAYDFGDYGIPTGSVGAGHEDLFCFVCVSTSKFVFTGLRRRID